MVVREGPTVEYKESVTPTFLKTVSAYANYGTGKIEFGVNDEGIAVGLADPVAECLRIENMINDSLDPAPRYSLEPDEKHGTVILTVYEGPGQTLSKQGKGLQTKRFGDGGGRPV
ncbi:MAG: helix-turn-helix domain-containing protein [Collinsella sp.]